MDKKPFLDRSLLIPIGIGVFSILGILIVMLAVYLDQPQTAVSAELTVTPFKYILLAAETPTPDPALATLPPQETTSPELPTPFPMVTSAEGFPAFPTQALSQGPILATNTVPGTAASSSTQKYDETDPLLLFDYDFDWVSRTGVGNAYQGTLMVSNEVGNAVTFNFEGQQIVIRYVGEPGLGSISILIDDDEFLLNQSAGNRWVSPQIPREEHFVLLIHEDGSSINLDYVEILRSN